jgi:hypothetical protein
LTRPAVLLVLIAAAALALAALAASQLGGLPPLTPAPLAAALTESESR